MGRGGKEVDIPESGGWDKLTCTCSQQSVDAMFSKIV